MSTKLKWGLLICLLMGIIVHFIPPPPDKPKSQAQVATEAKKAEEKAAGEKLLALRRLVKLYQSAPGGDISINELRKHKDDVELMQKQFITIPFDFKKYPTEAKQIVELYLQSIEGNYDGELPSELRSHIEPMWEAYHDEVKMPHRLLEKYQKESNR